MSDAWLAAVSALRPLADGTDDISPDWGFFPFMGTLKSMVGGLEAVLLLACLVAFLIGTVLWIFGKVSQNGTMGRVSGFVLVGAVFAAVLVAGAGQVISWATTNIQLT